MRFVQGSGSHRSHVLTWLRHTTLAQWPEPEIGFFLAILRPVVVLVCACRNSVPFFVRNMKGCSPSPRMILSGPTLIRSGELADLDPATVFWDLVFGVAGGIV